MYQIVVYVCVQARMAILQRTMQDRHQEEADRLQAVRIRQMSAAQAASHASFEGPQVCLSRFSEVQCCIADVGLAGSRQCDECKCQLRRLLAVQPMKAHMCGQSPAFQLLCGDSC